MRRPSTPERLSRGASRACARRAIPFQRKPRPRRSNSFRRRRSLFHEGRCEHDVVDWPGDASKRSKKGNEATHGGPRQTPGRGRAASARRDQAGPGGREEVRPGAAETGWTVAGQTAAYEVYLPSAGQARRFYERLTAQQLGEVQALLYDIEKHPLPDDRERAVAHATNGVLCTDGKYYFHYYFPEPGIISVVAMGRGRPPFLDLVAEQ